ncbi:MAG: hypothetical protein KatS3mg087_0071 [Patescibacteria group bacterium]|nr:MAG: hypothetical protein KatS3mg087_0071 [Patescibacteria group bacterium]
MKLIRSNILKSEDCFGTTALSIFLDTFGLDALEWIPPTVIMNMERVYGDLPESTFNKLFAAIEIFSTDAFYTQLDKFVLFCNTLSDGGIYVDPPDLDNVCWGVVEAVLLDPPDKPLLKVFDPKISLYIRLVLEENGLKKAPRCLEYLGFRVNSLDQALTSFSDDPRMYHALLQNHDLKSAFYDEYVSEKLRMLEIQMAQVGFKVSIEQELVKIVRKIKYS